MFKSNNQKKTSDLTTFGFLQTNCENINIVKSSVLNNGGLRGFFSMNFFGGYGALIYKQKTFRLLLTRSLRTRMFNGKRIFLLVFSPIRHKTTSHLFVATKTFHFALQDIQSMCGIFPLFFPYLSC